MTENLTEILDRLRKLENKARNIDEVYGHCSVPEDTPSRVPADGASADEIKAYIKDTIHLQKQDLVQFNQMIFMAMKNPADGDELVERFGGNTTIQDIYREGVFEIKSLITEYKKLRKSL